MDKEELARELKNIDEEIKKINSDYPRDLYKKAGEKELELRILREPIYKKYIFGRGNKWDIKKIKPSVKEGIKKGLGIKYLNSIYEGDIIKIVKELIEEDFEKTNGKEILSEIDDIE